MSARKGYLDGRALAEVFAWLRPGDLIWNYWVNNYLLGKRPPAFDILFWNSDTTRMTAGLHADFVDLAVGNPLDEARARSPCSGCRSTWPRSTVDSYVVAGIADHITPWENCYRTTQLFGGTTRFVLSTSGHIAALVNPPGNPKATFHTNDDDTADPDAGCKGAETHQGTWWNDVAGWLDERCGELDARARGARLDPACRCWPTRPAPTSSTTERQDHVREHRPLARHRLLPHRRPADRGGARLLEPHPALRRRRGAAR